MEFKPLLKALSVLLAIVALFMTSCLVVGLALGEGFLAVKAYGPSIALGLGSLLFSLSFIRFEQGLSLSHRSGYLFVVLAWVLSAAIGALPFMLYGATTSYADAFFETMSGFTTTGASIFGDVEALPDSLLLWRAMTHWLGGMGIVVLTVAILPLLGLNAKSVVEAEAPGPQVDKFTPRLSQMAKILWLIYLGMTVILSVLLMLGGMSILDAVTHSFAAMATGGFSTRNTSVAAYGSTYIDAMLTIFMVLAGINFSLYWSLLRGDIRRIWKDTELRVYLGIFAMATMIIIFDLNRAGYYGSVGEAARYASFQASSILTTTGFVTADYVRWPALSQTMLFVLMFIGGCAGSTGGGIKVSRIVTMLKMGQSEMRYLLNPRGIYGVFMGGQHLRKNVVYDIAAMVFLYIMAAFASTIIVAASGYDILTSLTATMACLGNIGPGFALVGPTCNYAFMSDGLKLWLSFAMLLGRLEVYTVLVLFTRAFWKR